MSLVLLYAGAVLFWGFGFISIKMQLGEVPIVVSVAYRFLAAAVLLHLFCRLTGVRLRYPWRNHLRFAAMGTLAFSLTYVLSYAAVRQIPSGLMATLFSTLVMWNILLAGLVLRLPFRPRVAAGAAMGVAGMALVFWRDVAAFDIASAGLAGLALGLASALAASIANIIAAAGQRQGDAVLPMTAWGMAYGGVLNALVALALGQPFTIDWSLPYLGSLAYLVLLGSIGAFLCYLTLLSRLGVDRAGYAFVLFPIVALGVSTVFEGYQWSAPALVGVALVLAGNATVMYKAFASRAEGGALGRPSAGSPDR